MPYSSKLHSLVISFFVIFLVLPNKVFSEDKVRMELNAYDQECIVGDEKMASLLAVLGGALVGEGVNYLFSALKKEFEKTGATYSASLFYPDKEDKPDKEDEPVTFKNIKCLETIRTDDGKQTFNLKAKIIYEKEYMRIVPKRIDFGKSAAKYGNEKDINVIYTFKLPTGKGGSMVKVSFGPISISEIKEGENRNDFKNISTDWVLVKDFQDKPFSITCDVVESSTEKGQAVASILIKTVENDELKKKVAEAIINSVFPEEQTEK